MMGDNHGNNGGGGRYIILDFLKKIHNAEKKNNNNDNSGSSDLDVSGMGYTLTRVPLICSVYMSLVKLITSLTQSFRIILAKDLLQICLTSISLAGSHEPRDPTMNG